jgi:predicted nucleotidyltransferase
MNAKLESYAKVTNPTLRKLLKHPAVALGLHWAFQSLFYMDTTERWFKLGMDLFLTLALGLALNRVIAGGLAWMLGFLLAHTLNFLFNGQLWGVLKTYGYVQLSYAEFIQYVEQVGRRAANEASIERLVVYGSLARKEWSPASDLDARILRRPGFMNGIRACWFLTKERSLALFHRFPLDLYVVDDIRSLASLRADEKGIELKDNANPVLNL